MKKSKEAKRPVIIGSSGLKLSKEARKSLFNYWYKYYGEVNRFRQDNLAEKLYDGDMDVAMRVEQVICWAGVMGDAYELAQSRAKGYELYKKYWDRFINKCLMPRVLKKGYNGKGVFPHEKKSTALYVYLSRGFVWEDEFTWEKDKYYVRCNLCPLWYPVPHNSHQDALATMKKIGINGYTSCPIAGSRYSH